MRNGHQLCTFINFAPFSCWSAIKKGFVFNFHWCWLIQGIFHARNDYNDAESSIFSENISCVDLTCLDVSCGWKRMCALTPETRPHWIIKRKSMKEPPPRKANQSQAKPQNQIDSELTHCVIEKNFQGGCWHYKGNNFDGQTNVGRTKERKNHAKLKIVENVKFNRLCRGTCHHYFLLHNETESQRTRLPGGKRLHFPARPSRSASSTFIHRMCSVPSRVSTRKHSSFWQLFRDNRFFSGVNVKLFPL